MDILKELKRYTSLFYTLMALFIGRVIQFYKEVVVAEKIGVSIEFDIFLMALVIVNVVIAFIITPMNNASLPILVRLGKSKDERTNIFFSKVFYFTSLSMIIIIFLIFTSIKALESLKSTNSIKQILDIIYILSPYTFFISMGSVTGIYLNSLNKNIAYSIYPAIPALFAIFFMNMEGEISSVYKQIYGINIGAFFAFAWLLSLAFKNGFRFVFTKNKNILYKIVFHQYFSLLMAGLFTALNPFIDRWVIFITSIGNVSHLEYGSKLFSIFSGILLPISSIIFYPYYCNVIIDNGNNSKNKKRLLTLYLESVYPSFLIVLVLTLLGIFFSSEAITVLFENGAFQEKDSAIVARIMSTYLLGLPFLWCGILGVRFLNALQENKVIMYLSFTNLILNILLNYILSSFLGIIGISLSTTIIYIINCGFYILYISKIDYKT